MSYAFSEFGKTYGSAAINNITAPTFAGVTTVTPSNDSSFLVQWSAATGAAATPFRYQVYVAVGASVAPATLFQASNIAAVVTSQTQARIFILPDFVTYIVNGQTYTFGVRALSSVGISESNTVTLNSTATGSGNLPVVYQTVAASLQATETALATQVSLMTTQVTNMTTQVTNLTTQVTQLTTEVTQMGVENAAFNASNVTYAAQNVTFATYLSTLATNLSTFATQLVTMTNQNTAFTNNNTALSSSITNLNTGISNLNAAVAALQAATAGIAGIGGFAMTMDSGNFVMTVEAEEVI